MCTKFILVFHVASAVLTDRLVVMKEATEVGVTANDVTHINGVHQGCQV